MTARRRRILLLSPFAPRHDSAYGTARLVAEQIEALAACHDVALLALRAADDPPTDDRVRRCCDVAEDVVRSITGGRVIDRVRRWLRPIVALGRGTPLWVVNWHEETYAARLRALVEAWKPDVVQAEFHVMGQYWSARGGARPTSACPRSVLVVHEPGHPAALERRRLARGAVRWARTLDARAWERFERTLLARVDAVVAFTERDVRMLAHLSPRPVRRIRPGIRIPPRPCDGRGQPPLSMTFVGNFTHPPNHDAAIRLITAIHPRLRTRFPGLRLYVVGDHVPAEVHAFATDDVIITGRVPDVVPFLDRAAIVVAPLRLGGGIRVKVLEALAAGKAVVGSTLAFEGLDVVCGDHCMVADTDDEIVAAASALLDDPALRARMAAAAHAWATANLGWPQAVAAYGALYDRLLDAEPYADGATLRAS